jgi:hypothetical protein
MSQVQRPGPLRLSLGSLGHLPLKPEDIMRVIISVALSLVMHTGALAQTAESACPQEAVDSSQWPTHDEGAFTLRLPPGLERQPSSSIDSQVRRWSSDSLRISYDYGYYCWRRPNILQNGRVKI